MSNRKSKGQFLAEIGAVAKASLVAGNTLDYEKDGIRKIRYHNTDIVVYNADGTMSLFTGGWLTSTTKERINRYLPAGVRLYQEKGRWYLKASEVTSFFYEGITLDGDTILNPELEDSPETKRLEKLIKAYCRKLKNLEELPSPESSGGDCLMCQFREVETGKPLGDLWDNDHLISHLEEGYIMFSLIFNALEWRGYGNPYFIYQMGMDNRMHMRNAIVRAVRAYFKAKLGLVR